MKNNEFFFSRRTLFPFLQIETLKNNKLKKVNSVQLLEEEMEYEKKEVLQLLNQKSLVYYQEDEVVNLKQIMTIKNLVKKNNINSFLVKINQNRDLFLQSEIKVIEQFYRTAEAVENIYLVIKNEFTSNSTFKFNSFVDEPDFIKGIKQSNIKYLESYNANSQKFSIARSMYNYVQRATVKTSPLTTFGTTVFYANINKKIEKYSINSVYISLLLKAAAFDVVLRKRLVYNVSPPLIDKNNHVVGCYYEKEFILDSVSWIIKQPDIMHQKDYLNFIFHQKDRIECPYEVLAASLDKSSVIDFVTLVSTGLILPSYQKYYQDKTNLLPIFKDILSKEALEAIIFNKFELTSIKQIEKELSQFIVHSLDKKYVSAISDFLHKNPLIYHNTYTFETKEKNYLNEQLRAEILMDWLKINPNFDNLYQQIKEHIQDFSTMNLLEILFSLSSKKGIQESERLSIKSTCKTAMNRSCLVYFQQEKQGETVINNIVQGTGHTIIRDIDIFNEQIYDEFLFSVKKLFKNDYPIYELVIDQDISNRIDVGKSGLPQICWPNDFIKITLTLNKDDELEFVFKGQKINILYQGTVPSHLFTGIKAKLMNLIHPWNIDFTKIKARNAAFRKTFSFSGKELSIQKKQSDAEFFIALYKLFHKKNYPLDFFIKEKTEPFTFPEKPIWMSLYSPSSIKILRKMLETEKEFQIEEVYPDKNSYGESDHCWEHVQWLIE